VSRLLAIHPVNPEPRLLQRAAATLRGGGVIALPTECCYTLCCHLDDRDAVMRLRRIRAIDDRHQLTLLCRDLSEIAQYAQVDNRQYRLLKATTPGPYTLILVATRQLPKRLSHPSRRTVGLRVPVHRVARALLDTLGQALIGTTLIAPGDEQAMTDGAEIHERFEAQIDLVIDAGACGLEPTTVIDLTSDEPRVVRRGRGSLVPFGLAVVGGDARGR